MVVGYIHTVFLFKSSDLYQGLLLKREPLVCHGLFFSSGSLHFLSCPFLQSSCLKAPLVGSHKPFVSACFKSLLLNSRSSILAALGTYLGCQVISGSPHHWFPWCCGYQIYSGFGSSASHVPFSTLVDPFSPITLLFLGFAE